MGFPLGHSLSPQIHLAALQATGLQGDYHLHPIAATSNGHAQLRSLLSRLRHEEIQGLNVTIPHKQTILPYLDELTESAQAIGAVNTLFPRNGLVIGDNTDAPAFRNELRKLEGLSSSGMAMVLGAGGSARAVVYALLCEDWQVHVLARKPQQAQELASHFDRRVQAFALRIETLRDNASDCSLVINTTPVGMAPEASASPWPEDLELPDQAAIYDLVYNPGKTRFVEKALAQGRVARSGGGMLVEQAALSFERWTGRAAPRDIMRQVFDKQLALEEAQSGLGSAA